MGSPMAPPPHMTQQHMQPQVPQQQYMQQVSELTHACYIHTHVHSFTARARYNGIALDLSRAATHSCLGVKSQFLTSSVTRDNPYFVAIARCTSKREKCDGRLMMGKTLSRRNDAPELINMNGALGESLYGERV